MLQNIKKWKMDYEVVEGKKKRKKINNPKSFTKWKIIRRGNIKSQAHNYIAFEIPFSPVSAPPNEAGGVWACAIEHKYDSDIIFMAVWICRVSSRFLRRKMVSKKQGNLQRMFTQPDLSIIEVKSKVYANLDSLLRWSRSEFNNMVGRILRVLVIIIPIVFCSF